MLVRLEICHLNVSVAACRRVGAAATATENLQILQLLHKLQAQQQHFQAQQQDFQLQLQTISKQAKASYTKSFVLGDLFLEQSEVVSFNRLLPTNNDIPPATAIMSQLWERASREEELQVSANSSRPSFYPIMTCKLHLQAVLYELCSQQVSTDVRVLDTHRRGYTNPTAKPDLALSTSLQASLQVSWLGFVPWAVLRALLALQRGKLHAVINSKDEWPTANLCNSRSPPRCLLFFASFNSAALDHTGVCR